MLLLLFRPFSGVGGPPPPPPPAVVEPSGVRKKVFRVRRADFSSQKNYELALKAALAEANLAILRSDEVPQVSEPLKAKPRLVVTDTAIKVSPRELAALQHAAEMEEMELLNLFITVIEDEWE